MNMEIKVLDTEEARKVMIVEVENVKNIGYDKLATYQGASKLLSYEVSTTGHASPSEGGCGHTHEGGAAEGGDKAIEAESGEGHSHDHSHGEGEKGGNGHDHSSPGHGDEFGNDEAPGEYDVEVESAWQTEEGGNLLVHIALFERGWSVAIPMTYGFIMKPDGELLEEVEPEAGGEAEPS
ncbi:hypothetical protein MNBD_DELTA02-181 [hydrothermal vent metagenome]|uniref:Uncharacterized protein n=1 Tax=hydrothermal vent metagenome TaxID=652676 RepID=A0A3B0V4W2_9ZZZZ